MTKSIKVVLVILVVIVLAAIKFGFQAAGISPGFLWGILILGGIVAIRAIWKYKKRSDHV